MTEETKPKVKQSGRRQKGRILEKLVAQEFGLLFYKDSTSLCANPLSGARIWKGDVIPNSEEKGELFNNTRPVLYKHKGGLFPFVIECKNTESFDMNLIFSDKNFIYNVIVKCSEEAEASASIPIVVMKRNRQTPVLFIPEQFFNEWVFTLHGKFNFHHGLIIRLEDWVIMQLPLLRVLIPDGLLLNPQKTQDSPQIN